MIIWLSLLFNMHNNHILQLRPVNVIFMGSFYWYKARYHNNLHISYVYNAVLVWLFLQNIHDRCPIAHPVQRGMRGLLHCMDHFVYAPSQLIGWVHIQNDPPFYEFKRWIYVLLNSLSCHIQYRSIWFSKEKKNKKIIPIVFKSFLLKYDLCFVCILQRKIFHLVTVEILRKVWTFSIMEIHFAKYWPFCWEIFHIFIQTSFQTTFHS